ncbi:hypothetical protein EYF80_046187 [Liparis tanakae]|uniref:Uncharacterized protein n=1 Tax=Liparis tanakae TaxID=230148 RepID=A0A4Z2FR55_9TELE|nr:hypothetical protein EYF80_046187 [Liparis tanakae]
MPYYPEAPCSLGPGQCFHLTLPLKADNSQSTCKTEEKINIYVVSGGVLLSSAQKPEGGETFILYPSDHAKMKTCFHMMSSDICSDPEEERTSIETQMSQERLSWGKEVSSQAVSTLKEKERLRLGLLSGGNRTSRGESVLRLNRGKMSY